jgi:VanZ family protein
MQAPDPERGKDQLDVPAYGDSVAMRDKQRHEISRYFLPAYALLIVYISLSPFSGWLEPENGAFNFLTAPWPRYITAFDIAANVLAYVPLGLLLLEFAHRRLGWGGAVMMACLGGSLISLSMEALQAYLPVRISSLVDFLANSVGVVAGALIAACMERSRLVRWMAQWRRHTFNESRGNEFGEALLAIWLFIQLNPSIPFFAAGTINSELPIEPNAHHAELPAYALPQGWASALSVCGFGLFVSVLLKPSISKLPFVVGVISFGAFLKMLAAGVLLKAPLMMDWINKDALIGIVSGLALTWIAGRLNLRWRIYVAAMMILAGGLLAKIGAIYDALSTILRVFNWPHGQLFNFTSLTLLLNEFWPLVALVYLLIWFVRLPASETRDV